MTELVSDMSTSVIEREETREVHGRLGLSQRGVRKKYYDFGRRLLVQRAAVGGRVSVDVVVDIDI